MRSVRVKHEYDLPKGMFHLSGGNGYAHQTLKITAAKHATEDCHAIAIATTHPHLVQFPVCTDRKSHPAVKTQAEASTSGNANTAGRAQAFTAPKEDPATKKLRETRTIRRTFAATLIAKKPPKEAIALMLLAYIEELFEYDPELLDVAVWLGLLELPEGADEETIDAAIGNRDLGNEVLAFAQTGEAQLQRAALAMFVQWIDHGGHNSVDTYIRHGDVYDSARRSREYLEFLRSQGYELSDLETKRLAGDQAKAA